MQDFFNPKYWDGQEVKVGDEISVAGVRNRYVTAIFRPDHEVSHVCDMTNGCVELTPNTLEELPLNEDIELVCRANYMQRD
jgi:hypothetical protein